MTKIIILPGLDGTGKMLSPFVDILNKQHSAEIISYPTEKALSYSELASFVHGQLPKEKPFALLAESFSGPVAALAIAKGTPGLTHLIFAASFIRKPTPLPAGLTQFAKILPLKSKKLLRAANPVTFGRWRSDALEADLHQAIKSVTPQVLTQRLKEAMQADVRNALSGFAKPALYLRPTHDRLISRSAAATIKATLPHLNITDIDAPHFILQTHPEACADAITNFAGICGKRGQPYQPYNVIPEFSPENIRDPEP